MDSLTQIVLGAAVGELAQGRKIGNRAMIWGAIAGTIPDLDVFIGKLYSDPVDELAFHRGITHSFFFAICISFVLSYLAYWIYDLGNYKKKWFPKVFTTLMAASVIMIIVASGYSSIGILGSLVLAIPTFIYVIYWLLKHKRGEQFENINLGVKGWYVLFFWAVITHPILDCFTVYGTQIFLPFSNYRVSFDNISVADPGYTLPFLLCVVGASILSRKSNYRSLLNKSGILISCLYMIWTFSNKHKVNQIVENTIAQEGISHSRYMTSPTILNNLLWTTTIESDSVFYQGQYSFFDEDDKFDLVSIPKNHDLLTPKKSDHTIETLKWFSNNYFGVMKRKDGKLQINDLRYGSFSGLAKDEDDFIFRFVVNKNQDGDYKLSNSEGGPPRGREKDLLTTLITRVKGKKSDKVVYQNGVVVSAHFLASEIGNKILREGGNAFDAAIAVNFALAVVYPRAGNIGGGGFATIYTKDQLSTTLDFREKAPGKAHRDMYLDQKGNVVPNLSLRGGLASGVPGAVKGMLALHDSLGSIDIKKLITPAIKLAKQGYAISANEASRLNKHKDDFLNYNDYKTPYTKTDKWKEGDTLRNEKLANTLLRLKNLGLDEFYTGETADLISAQNLKNGGLISNQDLLDYSVVWREPTRCNYKEYEILSMPPPSSGGVALCQILDGVELLSIDTIEHNSDTYLHKMAEVEKRVFTIRNQLMGDPDFVKINMNKLLSESFTKDLYRNISEKASIQNINVINQKILDRESFETTHFSIVDKDGNAISVTTTLNGNYGSFVVIENGGFLMNNQMDDFTAKPGGVNQYGLVGSEKNSIEGGKRMLSSMSPTIILRDNKPFMVLGSPGGPTIITSVLQTFLNVVDHEMTLQEAVDSPRFHDQGYPLGILFERNTINSSILDSLIERGHNLRFVDYIGAVEAIQIKNDGSKIGAADTKRGKDDAVRGH